MKRKIVVMLLTVVIGICGCSKETSNIPNKKPIKNEMTDNPIEDMEDDANEETEDIEIYYIDETTGEITQKEVSISGGLSKNIVEQLKALSVLSETCVVESISVNDSEDVIDMDVNTAFGEYIRGMGTTGSEQVLECVVRTYSEAYDCDGVKITENGNPLDTGHAVLEGYISYD